LLIVVDYDSRSRVDEEKIKLDERDGNLLPHIPVFEIKFDDFKKID